MSSTSIPRLYKYRSSIDRFIKKKKEDGEFIGFKFKNEEPNGKSK